MGPKSNRFLYEYADKSMRMVAIILTVCFFLVFPVLAQAPGTITLSSPSSSTTDSTPTFTWTEDTTATWYKIYIGDTSSSYKFTQWYETANVCSSGTCSVTPSATLSNGDYTWWIKGWNSDGNGPWSSGMTFTVATSSGTPGTATPGTPNGTVQSPVTYTWSEVSTATWYKLYIWDDNQAKISSTWYEASSICSGGSCSITDSTTLTNGDYQWFLKTWNSNGGGSWSSGQSFTVLNSTTPVSGEYGDAPDGGSTGYPTGFTQTGSFPSLYASNGARTLSVADAVLGTTASVETDANDTSDPDGVANLATENTDSDDAITDFFLMLTAIPPPATLGINVNGPSGGTGGTYYLNVLIDLDMDGEWGGTASGGEAEWVVQNEQVTVTPGQTTSVSPESFAFANGDVLPDGAWMRIALTKESISVSDWDGTGEFTSGEIEDHVITLPQIDSKDHPILVVTCGGPYSFGGAASIPVSCTVTNIRRLIGGTFDWTVSNTSGAGVDVQARSANNVGIGAGPANTVVGMTATRIAGDLPSTWRFIATPDPTAVVTAGGVTLGHSESYDDVEFEEEESAGNVYVTSVEGSFQHFDGYSEVYGYIGIGTDTTGLDSGLSVVVELLLGGSSVSTQTVTTDSSGNATATFTISSYGTYTVQVTGVSGNSATYDSSSNTTSSTTVVVN